MPDPINQPPPEVVNEKVALGRSWHRSPEGLEETSGYGALQYPGKSHALS